MPELPEVETVRRGLVPVMVGSTIARVECRRPDLRFPLPERFSQRVGGHEIVSLERRAKYLLAGLSGGARILMHLGMSGRLSVGARQLGTYTQGTGGAAPHDHVVFHLESGATITYNDPRRFGFILLIEPHEFASHRLLRDIGPEPLGPDFTPHWLASRARTRSVDLKSFLMDQHTVAGLGNIYVSEALHRAGLRPSAPAASLARASGAPSVRADRLVLAVRETLVEAIAAGGSSLRDYRQADGSEGGFQRAFRVYGRAGEPCASPGCRGIVRRSIQAGRASYHCRECQR